MAARWTLFPDAVQDLKAAMERTQQPAPMESLVLRGAGSRLKVKTGLFGGKSV